MSDIVERLKGDVQYEWRQIMREAAAEITRLRAELAAWKAVAEKRHAILLDLEWRVDCNNGEDAYCPCCVAFDGEKHTAGCKMAEAIAASSRAATDAIEKNAN